MNNLILYCSIGKSKFIVKFWILKWTLEIHMHYVVMILTQIWQSFTSNDLLSDFSMIGHANFSC